MATKHCRAIEVWAAWAGIKESKIGVLYATPAGDKEAFSFEYDPAWVKSPTARRLDPALHLYGGPANGSVENLNFGLLLDSSPGRWGRSLMERQEALASSTEDRSPRQLLQSEYLLGVYDAHRMGGLRFRLDPTGPFLSNKDAFAAPPLTSLETLEQACLEIEKDPTDDNRAYARWLQLLMAPGTSIGGTRPKAGVLDEKKLLWIAKIPSRGDAYDFGLWEYLAYQLAVRAGIEFAPSMVHNFTSSHHTFLTKRFDRTDSGERIHFASAAALLGRNDGDDHSHGASYLELAEFLIRNGAQPKRDLEQLWRRIVFSICVSNVEDHLRNHGFLLTPKGWSLSPAYDVNPAAHGNGLNLNISEDDNSQDLDLARSVAGHFRVKPKLAEIIIHEVTEAVRNWPEVATSLSIDSSERERMASAFRVADAART